MMENKKDFGELVLKLLNPLKEYYTEGRAGLDLGNTGSAYPHSTILMEAFSRPLWGLVPYWAGGGREDEFAAIYREGIANGTNPEHPEYWGGFHDCDQMFVEMAALAYSMLFAADVVWEPLPQEVKERVAKWLNGINRYEVADNNWQFFKILANVALMKRGMEYSPEKLEKCLARTEDFYLGEGWYQDGMTAQKDYYISFAIHFYSLIYAVAMRKEDPDRCNTYRERAGLFAQQFIYWFSEDGEALPHEAYLKNEKCICRVRSLSGNGEGIKIWGEPNTNLVTQNTEIPAVKYRIGKGTTEIETEIETEIY